MKISERPTGNSQQNEGVRRFFSGFASQWDSLYGGKRNLFLRAFDHTFRRDVYERYQLTFDRLGTDLQGSSVLDVGCASGIYCFEAARRGARKVVGLDMADGMISLAQAASRDHNVEGVCEFIASEFPVCGGPAAVLRPFDYGIVMGVMDYVFDADTFLAALRPLILRRAVLSFPGQHWLRAPLRRYRYQLLGRCDIHNYAEVEIRAGCAKAGFSRVEIQRLDHSGICYIVTVEP